MVIVICHVRVSLLLCGIEIGLDFSLPKVILKWSNTFWIKAFDHIIVNAFYLFTSHFVIAIMSPGRAQHGLQNLAHKPMINLHWDLLWF
jgi:hypothetical protein